MRIGGHVGLEVIRRSVVLKRVEATAPPAVQEANRQALAHTIPILEALRDCEFAPDVYVYKSDVLIQQDFGVTEPVTDWVAFRRDCMRNLHTMRQRGIRHGDFNGNNFIVRANKQYVVDWQEAHFMNEPPPQKAPLSDSYHLCASLWRWMGAPDVTDSYRLARRWCAILADLGADVERNMPLKGKRLLDLGCFQGDFCALAAIEGMSAHGVDSGGFRSGEDSIAIARQLWGDMATFHQSDIWDWPDFGYDVVLLMNTLHYLVEQRGAEAVRGFLAEVVAGCGRLYLKAPLIPTLIPTKESMAGLAASIGANYRELDDIAGRVLWRLERKESA